MTREDQNAGAAHQGNAPTWNPQTSSAEHAAGIEARLKALENNDNQELAAIRETLTGIEHRLAELEAKQAHAVKPSEHYEEKAQSINQENTGITKTGNTTT